MASCDVCPSSLLSATVYRSIKDDGSCSSPQTWAETFYAVDPRTGCGACPAGTEPWQLRSISASRCTGLACDVRKSHSCYMKNTEFPQTDCTTTRCGARYFVCKKIGWKDPEIGDIQCNPDVTYDTAWAGGMTGMINGSGAHGRPRPMACIKIKTNTARIYDTWANNKYYNDKYMVKCGVWRVVSCSYDVELKQVRCASATRTRLISLENMSRYTTASTTSNATLAKGMQDLDTVAGLCSMASQVEG